MKTTIPLALLFLFQVHSKAQVITDPTVTANPTAVCRGSSSLITLGSSQSGVSYTLRNNANNSIVAGPVNGTDSVLTISSGPITATTTYNVLAQTIYPVGSALHFDGINAYVKTVAENGIPMGNSNYTLEAWIKPTTSGTFGIVGWGTYGDTNKVNALLLGAGGKLVNAWGMNDLSLSAPTLTDGKWHHVAASFDGTTRKLYVDGVLLGSDTPTHHNVVSNINMSIGSAFGSDYFSGLIDEVRIWNLARSQADLVANMHVCLVGNETGLVSDYKMEEGSGLLASDATSNNNNAILTNMNSADWVTSWSGTCGKMSTLVLSHTVTVIVHPIPSPVINTQTNVNCNGNNTGSVSLITSSGTPPYSYSWSPSGGTAAVANGLISGNYTCTVTDSNGCSAIIQATITQPTSLTSTISAQNNVNCNGGNDGSLTISPTGGTAAYIYSWSPSGGTTATASSLHANTYTCTITDSKGCTSTATATISEPPLLASTISAQTNVSCHGGNNGSLAIATSGGTPAYSYSWSPSGGTNNTATGLSPGTYICTITDTHSCLTTVSAVITAPAALIDSVTSHTNVSCNGRNDGSAILSVNGGTRMYTYSWVPSGGNAAFANNLTAGTYTCTVTDANGCVISAQVVITQPPPVTIAVAASRPAICEGNGDTLTASGANAYSWTPSTGLNTSTGAVVVAHTSATTTYTVTGTTSGGCTGSNTVAITVNPDPLTPLIVANGNVLSTTVTGVTYQWYLNGNPIPGATHATDTARIPGNYSVVVTNQSGCSATSSLYTFNNTGIAPLAGNGLPLTVFPNPSSGDFMVTLNHTPVNSVFTLYNVIGKEVMNIQLHDIVSTISRNGLAEGVYFYHLQDEGGVIGEGRIIITR